MWDISIAGNGDLVMAASRDLGGVSGTDLLDQRISLRLRIHRGTWFFDKNGTLGSNLYRILGAAPQAALEIDAYVREALRPMNDEISVEDIFAEYDDDLKSIVIQVSYMQISGGPGEDMSLPGGLAQQTTVT